MIQDFIALSIVAGAVAYVGRVGWLTLASHRAGGCGSCGGCSYNKQPLVQIQVKK